jgi:DNA-binding NtrC family response regulator
METAILVVDSNEDHSRALCALLEREHYKAVAFQSLANLEEHVQETSCRVILIDLDTLPVDNRLFRIITKNYPTVRIMGLSSRSFHPELQEAMSEHIYANLNKPVDADELLYWLKSIDENESDFLDSPGS